MKNIKNINSKAKYFSSKVEDMSEDTLNRIREQMEFERKERERLGLPNLGFSDTNKEYIYSKYEELAEMYICSGEKIPNDLEKLLLDTKEERIKFHTKSITCNVTDEYISNKYGIKI